MMVRIMNNHPINNRNGPTCWDGKVHKYSGDLLDLAQLGKWLTKKVGFRFDFDRRASRVAGDKCIFFPKQRVVNVHCMWVEKVDEGET